MYILFEVPRKIKPILTATNERYKDFALENFIGISSFYSKRVYELLKQYEKIGEGRGEEHLIHAIEYTKDRIKAGKAMNPALFESIKAYFEAKNAVD